MKTTANLAADGSVFLQRVNLTKGTDMYETTVFVYGDFGGGTVTIQASPDQGATKINLRDVAGNVVSIIENDVYNIRLGDGSKLGDFIELYATIASSTAPDVTIDSFDNM